MRYTGGLPAAWCTLDDLHLSAGLKPFDLPNSGYLDWRELAVALVGASFPAVRTATASQVAATAAAIAAITGSAVGAGGAAGAAGDAGVVDRVLISKQQIMAVHWWFESRPVVQSGDGNVPPEEVAAVDR